MLNAAARPQEAITAQVDVVPRVLLLHTTRNIWLYPACACGCILSVWSSFVEFHPSVLKQSVILYLRSLSTVLLHAIFAQVVEGTGWPDA